MKVLKLYSLLSLTIILLISSCNQKSNEITSLDEQDENSIKKNEEFNESNILIIKGLRKLKTVIDNSDNNGFSDFFIFPTDKYYFVNPAEALNTFEDGIITKEYFIENCYVPNVDYDPSLDNLLGKLNLDLLKNNSIIETRFTVHNDECSYYYKIEIEDNNVVLTYKSFRNSNNENDEYICEPEEDTFYMKLKQGNLLFDQDKIQMIYETAAG